MKINIKDILDKTEEAEVQQSEEKPEPEQGEESATEEIEEEPEPAAAEEIADEEPETEEASETEDQPEPESDIDVEPEPESEIEEPVLKNVYHKIDFRKYGEIIAIAVAFVLLIGVMLCYTNLVPREVYAEIDGKATAFTSKAWTVEEFLESENIEYSGEDYISVPLTAFIHDGISLTIEHAVDYKITADGMTKSYKTLAETVGEALAEENIKLGPDDIVEPKLESPVKKGMTIVVKRVTIEEKTVIEKVPFKTIKKDDPSMNHGETKVVQKGKNGKAKVTYRIRYVDGKQVSKKKIKTKIITPKKDKIVKEGTKNTIDGFAYTKKFVVKAYSYTGGGRTAMGTPARVGEIAVDPSVIPLGTTVYIEGVGVRRAEDTGGNIKGNTIDIYMNTQSECINWGCRYVTIYM